MRPTAGFSEAFVGRRQRASDAHLVLIDVAAGPTRHNRGNGFPMGLLTPEFFLFLFAVGLVHWCMPARGRVLVLLCASLIFYGYWDPKLLLMLVAVTVANHFIVRRIAAATGSRLIWLRLGVVLQCTLLFTP